MQAYLPEWKLYLWKKLLLNNGKFEEGTVSPFSFMFFSEEEQKQLMLEKAQGEIYALNHFRVAKLAGGTPDIGNHQSIEEDYYSFHPINIMGALVELMDNKPQILSIEARIDKKYIAWYRGEKGKYEAMQHKKNIASLGGSGSSPYKPNPKYMSDPLCGLPENIYKKTDAEQTLTPDEFRTLANPACHTTHEFLVLKIKINKAALQAKLNDYISNFESSNLVASLGVEYFDPNLQRENVYASIQKMTAKFGTKNLKITPKKIAQYSNWMEEDKKHYRIFETLFSLEKTGEIEITNLQKDEVILSLVDKLVPEEKNIELSSVDKKKLYILEKLKEEFDLAPKQSISTNMGGAYSYRRPVGEVDIFQNKFGLWLRECEIDFNQLQSILATFQEKGIIINFSVHNEYE